MEMSGNLGKEIAGIQNDNWEKGHGNQGNLSVHREHNCHIKYNQKNDTKYFHQLICNEVSHNINVGCASLDDITCLILYMPAVWQLLNVIIQAISHALYKAFGAFTANTFE